MIGAAVGATSPYLKGAFWISKRQQPNGDFTGIGHVGWLLPRSSASIQR